VTLRIAPGRETEFQSHAREFQETAPCKREAFVFVAIQRNAETIVDREVSFAGRDVRWHGHQSERACCLGKSRTNRGQHSTKKHQDQSLQRKGSHYDASLNRPIAAGIAMIIPQETIYSLGFPHRAPLPN